MAPTLQRTCHVCGKSPDTRVWYSTVREQKLKLEGRRKARVPVRVYVCPSCFFERLDEGERADYQKEAVGGAVTASAPA